MNINKKALTLLEVMLSLLCFMIFFVAVTNSVSNHNLVVNRMIENNNVMMIMNGINSKLRNEFKFGNNTNEIDYEKIEKEYTNDVYRLILRPEPDKVTILLGFYSYNSIDKFSIKEINRVYKKEVFIDE